MQATTPEADLAGLPAAVFWDMDGTLTDSEPLWEKATYRLSRQLGKELVPEVRELTVGGTFAGTFAIIADYAGYNPQPGDEQRFEADMQDYVAGLYDQELVIFPGVRELLEQLHAAGVPMMVTTNTQRAVADPVISAIGSQYFVGSVCGDEVPAGKPAPDMYLEAAHRVGADPASCLVFEDSQAGMSAAVAAGCRVIGLPAESNADLPTGAVPVCSLHTASHLAGASIADVRRWWAVLTLNPQHAPGAQD
ncbi:HAD family phosphatase [Corynebacterium lizhenjunii]|uniref:HAD family phosphatase n=1 Tax=Corynebacterium lizhenjunii TaxID=2709394 RepID=A0A7T0KHI4_9CORY|nr:HAD family phosphatase [Corynebacterium lizhenjunii]QPK80200.1 HAD family phosphatase [Corynebacterium lizhenjunii]